MSQDERPSVWVGHITLATSDIPRTRDFMIQLGMRPIADGDDHSILELRGGTHLVLTSASQPAAEDAYFDLMVDDLDAVHAQCHALGFAPTKIESGRIHHSFSVKAPSGHTIKFNSSHVSKYPV